MRNKLTILAILLYTAVSAHISHVGFGGGTMQFSFNEQNTNITGGFGGYLDIGFDGLSDDGGAGGVGITFGGDSQITYGGEDYGHGMVGIYGFRQINIVGSFRFIAKVGLGVAQTYERVNMNEGIPVINPLNSNLPQLKDVSYGAFAAVGFGIGGLEVTYLPMFKGVQVGFRLFKG